MPSSLEALSICAKEDLESEAEVPNSDMYVIRSVICLKLLCGLNSIVIASQEHWLGL